MTSDPLTDVRIALTALEGAVTNLATKVEAGDKQSEQLVALLKPRLDQLDRDVAEGKDNVADLRGRSEAALLAATNELRAALLSHSHEDAPHDRSLGVRVGALERGNAQLRGALAVLSVFTPVVTTLLTRQFGA